MASALPSNSPVFLLDDRNDFWFEPTAKAFRDGGWRCADTEWFGPSTVGNLTKSDEIAEVFFGKIRFYIETNKVVHFAIVTDSEFGSLGEAGACLLHRIKDDKLIGNRFAFGAVYSTNPKGTTITGKIEKLTQRSYLTQLEADAQILVNFFKTGEIGAAGKLVSMIERLCFFDWLHNEDFVLERLGQCRGVFRPVLSVGQPDWGKDGEFLCDPILKGLGSDVATPFAAATLRWFEPVLFESIERLAQPGEERELVHDMRQVLCPLESLSAAAENCIPQNGCFAAGSLRLLWDATISGNRPELLQNEYYPELQKNIQTNIKGLWNSYQGVFQQLSTHGDVRSVILPLFKQSLVEVAIARKAAALARKRGVA